MKRRDFVKQVGLLATWTTVPVLLQACSSDDPATPPDDLGYVPGTIGSNHGHSVRITDAQIAAGEAVVLEMTGGTHVHTVGLSAAQVAQIGAGELVNVTSSSDSLHAHMVFFNPPL